MLASSSLSYDSLLAHAPAKKGLPKGVVDLVRSCMIQVFPLQVYLGPSILAECTHNHNGTQQGDTAMAHRLRGCEYSNELDTRQLNCEQLTSCSVLRVCRHDIRVTPGLHSL